MNKVFLESCMPDGRIRVVAAHQSALPFDSAVVFGAGGRGRRTAGFLLSKGVEVKAFSDNDKSKHGTTVDGIPLVAPERLSGLTCPIVIASMYESEIRQQLWKMGLYDLYLSRVDDEEFQTFREVLRQSLEKMHAVHERLNDEPSRRLYRQDVRERSLLQDSPLEVSPYIQYDHPEVGARPGDVILDVGGMHGETSIFFAQKTEMNCKVFTFEPSPCNYPTLVERIKPYPGVVEHVPHGAWSSVETLRFNTDFSASDPGSHRIDACGGEEISVIDIDSFVEGHCNKVDLIKMDIEGAELEALRGARETIGRFKPKLQISTYHKLTHMWEIFDFINAVHGDYEYYFGHHSPHPEESVLYAVHRG